MKKASLLKKTSLDLMPALNGLVIDQGDGMYVELLSEFVPESNQHPQGISFKLTLRDRSTRPLMRYATEGNFGVFAPKVEGDLCVNIRKYDPEARLMGLGGVQTPFDNVPEMLWHFFKEVDLTLNKGDRYGQDQADVTDTVEG